MNSVNDNLHHRVMAAMAGCDAILRDQARPAEVLARAEQIKRVLQAARWSAFQLRGIALSSLPEPPVSADE